jgi:hypothetical protein
MRCAERLITRTVTGPYDWSIETAQAIQAVRYWRLRLRHVSILKVTQHRLAVTRSAAGLPNEVEEPVATLILVSNLREA